MEEAKQISEVDPESAVQTTRVEPSIHQRVMAFDHHKAFTFEAMHRRF